MSPSDELPLFRDAPASEREASVPSWRPTPADGWSRTPPSLRAVESQSLDLLRRGLEFLTAVERVPDAVDDARIGQFRERHRELAEHLVSWPDVDAGDDEAVSAARLVAAAVDELAELRREILQDMDSELRGRTLGRERRAGSAHRETQRIRKLAEFLLSEAAGETVELRLSSSFRPMSPMPDRPSASLRSAGLLGPADVDAMVHDYVERMRAEQERRPLPARGRLATLLASIPAAWLDAIWAALDLDAERPRHRKERERRIAGHLTEDRTVVRGIVHNTLSAEERSLVAYLVESDGRAPAEAVTRRFGPDRGDGWFWDENPPTSTLGRVRLHGLAFVGVDASSGRRMRTVLLPRELRERLREALAGAGEPGAVVAPPRRVGPEPRPDVEVALEDAFPDGEVVPVWLEGSWMIDAWGTLKAELSQLPGASLLHEHSPHEAVGWSVDLGFDDDETASWRDLNWGEPERSYGLFFLGPEGEGFRFEIESEFLDEEGRLYPTSGVGHVGWAVAVSAVAPFALLRVRSLDTEEGVPSLPDIETRFFDEAGRPQPEEAFHRETLTEREGEVLDALRERIVAVLKGRGIATLTEEEVTMPIPWLRASEEVFATPGPEGSLTVEDGLFFRCL